MSTGDLRYREFAPVPRLAPLVERLWLLEGDREPSSAPEPVRPDGHAELILDLGAPFEHHRDDGQIALQPSAPRSPGRRPSSRKPDFPEMPA